MTEKRYEAVFAKPRFSRKESGMKKKLSAKDALIAGFVVWAAAHFAFSMLRPPFDWLGGVLAAAVFLVWLGSNYIWPPEEGE